MADDLRQLRAADARNRFHDDRFGRAAAAFDGSPEAVVHGPFAEPERLIRLATAFGYRFSAIRGRRLRRYVFELDPSPAGRASTVPFGTDYRTAARHPAVAGRSARALDNLAAHARFERRLPQAIVFSALIAAVLAGLGRLASTAPRGEVLAIPMAFFALLASAFWVRTVKWSRTARRLAAEAAEVRAQMAERRRTAGRK